MEHELTPGQKLLEKMKEWEEASTESSMAALTGVLLLIQENGGDIEKTARHIDETMEEIIKSSFDKTGFDLS